MIAIGRTNALPVLRTSSEGMSKKKLERAIGGLYKDRRVDLEDDGVRLLD